MHVNVPDPHPGRCLNTRMGRDCFGYPRAKRCLDYEGHDTRCKFPEDPPMASISLQQLTYTGSTKPPEPWVSPLDDGGPV